MPAFDVLTNPTSLPQLKPGDKKTIVVTATSRLTRAVTGRAVPFVEPRAFAVMVKPPARAEQNFSQAGVTQEFPFSVEIPADAKAGSFTVRIDVVDVDHQDDNFGQSPVLKVVVVVAPVVQPPPKKKWWIWVAIAVAAIVVVAVVLKIALGGGRKMPDVVKMNFTDAQAVLAKDSIRIQRVDTLNSDTSTYKPDVVIEQKPRRGAKLNKDTNSVRLVVQTPFAVVPVLSGQVSDTANHRLGLAGFPNIRAFSTCNNNLAFNGKVFHVLPREGTLQARNTQVTFWVGAFQPTPCPVRQRETLIQLERIPMPARTGQPRIRPDS